ncbi:MAG TPA: hypothetical protein VJV78_16155 [Polyangiales bacterium]|nr:hypothetical protein [Polyangiales bacterium]
MLLAAVGCSGDDGETNNPSGMSGTGAAPAAGTSGSRAGNGGTPAPTAGAAATSGKGGSSGTPSPTAGRSGSGGAGTGAGTGGAGTTGGTGGNAGMSGGDEDSGVPPGTDDEDAGVCMPPPNPLNTAGFPKCSADICPAQDSVCVPKTFLDQLKIPAASVNLLADCNATDKCVPVALASQAGRQILPKCVSLNGAEGRCLSSCVPQVKEQAAQLPRSTCTGTDLCAPCYDPRTGKDTTACSQGCDTGPTEPPKPFPKCCSGRGLCVPPSLAADQASSLARDSCSAGNLCAPTELTDPTFKPKTCNSLDGAEGRCISTCAGGAVAQQKDRLPTAGCGSNEVCAPCFDPITGDPTGSCTINGDKPAKPKYTFGRCCGSGQSSAGVCVAPALAGDQASILRKENCATGKLCAPVAKAKDPKFRFPVCYGLLGTGACVNECILDPAQAGILQRDGCAQGEKCAPCSLLGSPTGACE